MREPAASVTRLLYPALRVPESRKGWSRGVHRLENFVLRDLHFLGEIHHTSRIHHRRTGDPIFPIPGGIHVSIWI
jgi:hypothetical protein